MEIQANVGSIADKVDFAYGFFEKQVPIVVVFQKDEMIDIIGVTKVGVSPVCPVRLTGISERVSFTVARASQNGYHHRTEMNKKIYKLGKTEQESHTAMTEKDITPIGGFPHYGFVKDDYLLINGYDLIMGCGQWAFTT
ncbi:hypothetical protein MKW98_006182 [Papaver atlanticum]|uniref:Uncharacterized protein n=1 Tax=Papaver atlanticum TaxID=357466 RepID=A0AAD4XXJ3_9MAGN|nr:hypothetical protein MKW98_006182 [Papaver atlanticum]